MTQRGAARGQLSDALTLAEVVRDLAGFWNYRALPLRHRETATVLARLSELSEGDADRRLIEAVSATALSTPSCVLNGPGCPRVSPDCPGERAARGGSGIWLACPPQIIQLRGGRSYLPGDRQRGHADAVWCQVSAEHGRG